MLRLVQVSIYGHSLGSVLSYDILCHQENLSSPFPMDSMYKEHAKGEKISHDSNNQSSMCNTSVNLDDKSFSSINDTEDVVGPIDDESKSTSATLLIHDEDVSKIVSDLGDVSSSAIYDEDSIAPDDDEKIILPTLLVHEEDVLHRNTEDASSIVDTGASDFSLLTASAITSKQSSGKEDIHDSRDLVMNNSDILDENTIISSGRCNDALEEISEEMCEDKDKIIKSLSKEVSKYIESFILCILPWQPSYVTYGDCFPVAD